MGIISVLASRYFIHFRGGRDDRRASCGLVKILVEAKNNVEHHWASQVERLPTPDEVSYIVQCLPYILQAYIVSQCTDLHILVDTFSSIKLTSGKRESVS